MIASVASWTIVHRHRSRAPSHFVYALRVACCARHGGWHGFYCVPWQAAHDAVHADRRQHCGNHVFFGAGLGALRRFAPWRAAPLRSMYSACARAEYQIESEAQNFGFVTTAAQRIKLKVGQHAARGFAPLTPLGALSFATLWLSFA